MIFTFHYQITGYKMGYKIRGCKGVLHAFSFHFKIEYYCSDVNVFCVFLRYGEKG